MNERLEKSAASVILGAWSRKQAVKKGMEFRGAYKTVRRACLMLVLRRRRTVKRRAAGRIMTFMMGIAVSRFRAVMLQYRTCVIKAQRYYRSFRACKHARILALNVIWDEVETELRIIERQNRQRRLRKMLRKLNETSPWLNAGVRSERVIRRRAQVNAKGLSTAQTDLFGVILTGDEVDGIQFVVGDRTAARMDMHLRDGLRMIMRRNELKSQTVQEVPFNIRFEVLHRLLSELRKKHTFQRIKVKQHNKNIERQITREKLRSAHIASVKRDKNSHRSGGAAAPLVAAASGAAASSPAAKRAVDIELDTLTMGGGAGKQGEVGDEEDTNAQGIKPDPHFIVYTKLGESALLTIVNAGRQLFERQKKEGYKSGFNVKPMYTPDSLAREQTAADAGDEVTQELIKDQIDVSRVKKAHERRDANVHAKLKVMAQRGDLLRAALEKEKRGNRDRRRNNKKKGKRKPGIIVTVPSAYKSRVGVSKFA